MGIGIVKVQEIFVDGMHLYRVNISSIYQTAKHIKK